MQLSERLKSIAAFVSSGGTMADIGCDHGYLPIFLCRNGLITRAIAADVRPGPLERAREHIREADLEDRIGTRLSDGLSGLAPGEADSIVISGMGGILITRILSDGADVAGSAKELILGPQSDTAFVRRYLSDNGFMIDKEDLVQEYGKFYPILHVVPCDTAGMSLTDIEEEFGPFLLKTRHAGLYAYLRHRRNVVGKLMQDLAGQESPSAKNRLIEITEEMRLINAAAQMYEVQ